MLSKVVFMGAVAAVITAAVALLALIGGYVQFVLRRVLLPCIEFDVEFLTLHRCASDELVGDILCRIRNEGPAVGHIKDVRYRIKYRLVGESGEIRGEPDFAHSLLPDETVPDELVYDKKWFKLDTGKRFIQPGVTQWYRKPVVFRADTCLIHVWGRFEYELKAGKIATFLAKFLGQPYGETPVEYIVRRTFTIGNDAKQQA
jgi:hypothetical protein